MEIEDYLTKAEIDLLERHFDRPGLSCLDASGHTQERFRGEFVLLRGWERRTDKLIIAQSRIEVGKGHWFYAEAFRQAVGKAFVELLKFLGLEFHGRRESHS